MRKRINIFLGVVLGLLFLVIVAAKAPPTLASQAAATSASTSTAEATEAANPCVNPAATAAPTSAAAAPTAAGTEAASGPARPSNAGGPGPALKLKGDPVAGKQIYIDNCQKCHGPDGTGGVANPGSDDGTVPALNPIDTSLMDTDPYVYACNLDLFIEHGSVPSGPSPQQTMVPWGDEAKLTPQQIADVIAYVISLNPVAAATAAAP
jgi:mono/diheme cytochrome c family protein